MGLESEIIAKQYPSEIDTILGNRIGSEAMPELGIQADQHTEQESQYLPDLRGK